MCIRDRSYADANHFSEGETWLTGQEAVEKGLADEVIEIEEETEEENLFNRALRKMQTIYGLPVSNAATPAEATPPTEKVQRNIGGEEMTIKNASELREEMCIRDRLQRE